MARRAKVVGPVEIVDFAHKGKVIGKDAEGHVYLVDGAVPGDKVMFLYKRNKKGLRAGKVTEFVEKSPWRIEAVCDHFGQCGGCKYQNLGYDTQLKFKEKMVFDSIRRLAKDEATIHPIIGCKNDLDYRNKMMYSFSTDRWLTQEEIDSKEENLNYPALGFHSTGSFYRVVDVHRCYLMDGLCNDIRNFVRELSKENNLPYYDLRNNVGLMRNLMVRRTSTDEYMVVMCFGADEPDNHKLVLDALVEKFPQITSLFYIVNLKLNDSISDQETIHYYGATVIVEKLGELKFEIGPKSFFQTNSAQTNVLYDKVKECADLKPTDRVYDLYCGLGSISLYVAGSCAHVVGIEEVPMAIEDAKRNMKLNGIENCDFHAGDVRMVMNQEFTKIYGRPDVVITDPPRAGMHEKVVLSLLALEAPKIVYVSCNPSTQARDVNILKEKYNLLEVTPVDMFPQTAHVESVAVLTLK